MLQPDDDRTFSGESSYWPAAANFHLCTRSRGPLTILRPGDDTRCSPFFMLILERSNITKVIVLILLTEIDVICGLCTDALDT